METIFLKNVSIVLYPIMDTLTKILESATELFRQYGFKSITMDDIARRSGISKKTLYLHFANKQEVVTEAVAWFRKQFQEQCQQILTGADNAVEGMVQLMTVVDQMLRQINPMAMLELEKYYPDGYKRFRNEYIQGDVEAMQKNIEQGITEGLYRQELDAALMAKFHIETSLVICQSSFFINERNSLQYINRQIIEHFMYGIMTEKGQKLFKKYRETYLNQASKV
ncbi:TetR/AcrR family transcriptional regulator [Chitinophagaceae bacterium MMS25-I14]